MLSVRISNFDDLGALEKFGEYERGFLSALQTSQVHQVVPVFRNEIGIKRLFSESLSLIV